MLVREFRFVTESVRIGGCAASFWCSDLIQYWTELSLKLVTFFLRQDII